MQTVNQGDKATKRVREEGTYTAETTTETWFKLRYNKKPKLNLVDKEKETIEAEDTDVAEKNNEPATKIINEEHTDYSNTQVIEKQQNMEASSSQRAEDKDIDIREKYKQIKTKNEEIKNEIYSQYLKQTPGIQNRLLSAFYYSNRK